MQWHLLRWVQMSGTGKGTLTHDKYLVLCTSGVLGHENSPLVCGCIKDPVLQ